mgnify:FL=1
MKTPPFNFAKPDYPLAPETFYKVGGPAEWALFPRNSEEAAQAFAWAVRNADRMFVMGRGSNLLVSDSGFSGAVLFTRELADITRLGEDRYRIASGVDLQWLVREIIVPNNYDATGGLTGIPGSVGGAIVMNAGTVNGATCQWLESVDIMHETDDAPRTLCVTEDDYAYRSQTFCGPRDFVFGGVFQFQRSARDQREVFAHYMARRRDSQPQGLCCGSVFKNPPGDHAGRLIEACRLKGTRIGGAVVSPRHANFIMNEDCATFDDILALIELCKTRVHEQFGILLEEEVRIIA